MTAVPNIFCQIIGITVNSDQALFLPNPFLYYHESKSMNKNKKRRMT